MIDSDIRVNGEFYVCPVYNEAIQDNKNIIIRKLKKCGELEHQRIWSLS